MIRVLEFTQVDRFIPSSRGLVGRPPKDRVALARAFVAKAVLDLPTTEALIDRLKADQALRRICGFERFHAIPDASRFSRVFAEFTALELPARVDEALIRAQLGKQIVGHIARDSTAIEAREKPAPEAAAAAPAEPAPAPAKKRGRPRKGEERPKELTVLERQVGQSVAEVEYDLADTARGKKQPFLSLASLRLSRYRQFCNWLPILDYRAKSTGDNFLYSILDLRPDADREEVVYVVRI